MIEIEKKVLLDGASLRKITNEAKFSKKKVFTDAYYDTKDIRFTLHNTWLRKRDQRFELKIGLDKEKEVLDRYEEVTDPWEIAQKLNLSLEDSTNLEVALEKEGIEPFCSFTTNRESYQWKDFSVDIDVAHCNSLVYSLAEFEICASSIEEAKKAEDTLRKHLEILQIDIHLAVPAKLTYFLHKFIPEHYEKLVAYKVIKPIENTTLLHNR